MPRVVPDQREKFENDELFRKMSRESEVSVRNMLCIVIDHIIDYRYITAWLILIVVITWAYRRRL